MLVIGERINGMFKEVRRAIEAQDKAAVQRLAREELEAGANVLDVNLGPAQVEPLPALRWLVEAIREVTKAPLAIDTTKADLMEEGLRLAGPGSFLNSSTGQEEKLRLFLPLAAKYDASLIALTIDEKGVPADSSGRTEIGLRIVAAASEAGLDPGRLYIDPVILPVRFTQPNPGHVLGALREVRLLCDPPPKTVLGLSNVSQGSSLRELINRTFLVMALGAGLDAAIVDPLDRPLMEAMITAELLLNRHIYCDDFLKAYRAGAG
jgi:5-methyltetrahydrofolate corrinoid/iron sulfur protein methyltransferase